MLALLDLLFPPRDTERTLRHKPEDCLIPFLDPIVTESGVTALLPYDEPLVRAAVLEAKFHSSERAARMLGSALTAYLKEELRDRATYEKRQCILVPVPLSQTHQRERGYNQAEAIARHVAIALNLPLDTFSLIRTHDSVRQNSPGDALALARAPDPAHLYIVIDDVTTTDSTLLEVAATFIDDVILIALAQ